MTSGKMLRHFSVSSQSTAVEKLSRDEIAKIINTCQAVCFDVDSTVIPEEGIDQLAAFKGAGEAVAAWTAKAMGGDVLFQNALAARLDLIQPSKADLQAYLAKNPVKLTPGVKELVDKLHQRGKAVYLVSGGFRQMIEPVAEVLRVPVHRIYANNILFDEAGAFAGFDAAELTSRDGGKPAVIKQLIEAHGYSPICMVGDGVTDMQAKPPADLFIGFGGVVVRDNVQKGADWFVRDFQQVIDVLDAQS